ncbi:hypothetical protein FraEuI1c_5402 [Pseudofrankia inefficax]|uniref:Uncharacterized protein n=1 Tax=Pseudofrankia inefficax (strain DSM 45817 / CECT 9037 / DDB 130130 / EuI1c) TaxID=298654 RepID=E3J9M5_PSEI1|nr:hypothetical protein FraEuI1c_5402 [Pseudofrankia inefficax]
MGQDGRPKIQEVTEARSWRRLARQFPYQTGDHRLVSGLVGVMIADLVCKLAHRVRYAWFIHTWFAIMMVPEIGNG